MVSVDTCSEYESYDYKESYDHNPNWLQSNHVVSTKIKTINIQQNELPVLTVTIPRYETVSELKRLIEIATERSEDWDVITAGLDKPL